jgi:hypothetical protein
MSWILIRYTYDKNLEMMQPSDITFLSPSKIHIGRLNHPLKERSQEAKSHSAPTIPKYFNYFPYFHE